MLPLLYRDLVPWYRLLDPYEDHLAEATSYKTNLLRVSQPDNATLLDLGAGAGNNAYHLVDRFTCTLVDLSPDMSQLSRELLPQCDHLLGDMRAVRLGRTFDAVLVHDAIMYMTNEADLRAAIQTAFVHTRPGGAALFAPDCVRETFRDHTEFFEANDDKRSMRGMEWSWDPNPQDDQCMAEYSFLLREGTEVESVHDRHVEGLFSRKTWIERLEGVGYRVELVSRPLDEEGQFDEVFLCVR
ncbi:MAG TPA: class I SAM-dependent methyltransferase [Polyangium sp.]|nr:class I SAM-dependent methyltransferase [Polyangium sp.]